MGRTPCCSKDQGLNRGAWTTAEDQILSDYVKTHGQGKWRNIPKKAGLNRCGKSCRLRWLNYLRPDIKRGNITDDEEELIIRLHKLLGNRWSLIAGRLPGRTDNEIKNYWNTIVGKKIINQPSPLRRSSSCCTAHDPPEPTIKRSYSFAGQPQTAADPQPPPSCPIDHNSIYQNATVVAPRASSSSLLDREIDNTGEEVEPFSPAAFPDNDKTVPAPENFMMDLDMDKDFISDILNGAEFLQLNPEQHHHRQQQQSMMSTLFDQQYDLQTMGSFAGTDQLDWLINL